MVYIVRCAVILLFFVEQTGVAFSVNDFLIKKELRDKYFLKCQGTYLRSPFKNFAKRVM